MLSSLLVVSIGLAGGTTIYQSARTMRRELTTEYQLFAENRAFALRDNFEILGDELKRLADTFDDLVARLAGAFDAQRRFVSHASHELRTPLTVSRALLQAALTDPSATTESFRATTRDAIEVADQQERLIEALLLLARSERGLDHREPVDLAAIATEILSARQP